MPTPAAALCALLALAGCSGDAPSPGIIGTLALTPDDQTVVFPYRAGRSVGLYRADLDGHDVRLVAEPPGDGVFLDPAVSPDGRLVAFSASKDGVDWERTLMVVPLSGGTPREIPTGIHTVTEVAFSRDGRRLFVLGADEWRHSRGPAGDYTYDVDLYVVGVDGRGLRRLTSLDASVMEELAVVGDSERVVVRLGVEAGDSGSYVFIDPARPGAEPVPVWEPREGLLLVENGAVSPDGQRVAYTDLNERTDLFVMDIATQRVQPVPLPVPEFPGVGSVRWFHRRDALLFHRYDTRTQYYGPARVDLDGSGFADVRIDSAAVLAGARGPAGE